MRHFIDDQKLSSKLNSIISEYGTYEDIDIERAISELVLCIRRAVWEAATETEKDNVPKNFEAIEKAIANYDELLTLFQLHRYSPFPLPEPSTRYKAIIDFRRKELLDEFPNLKRIGRNRKNVRNRLWYEFMVYYYCLFRRRPTKTPPTNPSKLRNGAPFFYRFVDDLLRAIKDSRLIPTPAEKEDIEIKTRESRVLDLLAFSEAAFDDAMKYIFKNTKDPDLGYFDHPDLGSCTFRQMALALNPDPFFSDFYDKKSNTWVVPEYAAEARNLYDQIKLRG
jgi:hypothetical protein